MDSKNRSKNDHKKWIQKMITKNGFKKWSRKMVTKNRSRKMVTKNGFKKWIQKSSQKIITKNHHKKSSQKIITKNNTKKTKKNPPLCLNLHFLSIAVNPPQTNYKPQFAPFWKPHHLWNWNTELKMGTKNEQKLDLGVEKGAQKWRGKLK